MSEQEKDDEGNLIIRIGDQLAIVPKSERKCKAFELCIQPHICDASGSCIWGVGSEVEE